MVIRIASARDTVCASKNLQHGPIDHEKSADSTLVLWLM